MTIYSVFYYNNKVGTASGETTWQALENFVTLHEGMYVRKYLYAKPAITAYKKSNPFKKSKNKANAAHQSKRI